MYRVTKEGLISCSQNSYTIFGVEGANCYCGNTLVNQPTSASPDDCSINCAGNPQEICGGNWRINIYSSTETAETTKSTTASPTETPGGGEDTKTSNNIALGVGIGIGIPTLIATIIGVMKHHSCFSFWQN